MRILSVIIVTLCTTALFSCREKPVDSAEAKKATSQDQKIVVPVKFTPPKDSSISPKQASNWNTCNDLLDSLTIRYADSFKVDDAVAILRYQEDFISAQDRICVKAGLKGGYQEYKWILLHMNVEKNRSVIQAVNAQTF